MPAYIVTAIQPLKHGNSLLTEFKVEVEKPIEWVREHAMDIAQHGINTSTNNPVVERPIVALNVAAI